MCPFHSMIVALISSFAKRMKWLPNQELTKQIAANGDLAGSTADPSSPAQGDEKKMADLE